MDDTCAVCAENLEWTAYGPCGHREVCSTCVIRLRFICNDRRCCICKTESTTVFVTKALGEYTTMVNDFSLLPAEPREGPVKSYWYHEDSQAFFDDLDQYKMVKAMCRLSCSVCDQIGIQSNDASRRTGRFRSVEQLKGHLFHRHRLLMCSLCLEGRKVFICEQKLYTRSQLTQHRDTGDSEVDGDERERGGFMGHPMCHFCRTPFYGDNELYSHMSTDHYTCHICQRRHPGQYEYYKNYDDLEIHFRHEHFLCEDEACLAKKFVVFPSEGEIKRHNALEHGGRMSRSKRNAALQIPVSFQYRRNNEHERRRGRGPSFRHDHANDISAAIEASLQTASASSMSCDPPQAPSTLAGDNNEGSGLHDAIVLPFEAPSMTDSEASSRYLQALSASRNQSIQASYFPPLTAAQTSQPKDKRDPKALPSMAARLRRQSKGVVINNDSSRGSASTSTNSNPWPSLNNSRVLEASENKSNAAARRTSTSYAASTQATPPPPSAVVGDVHTANRSLVEQIRAVLGFDEGKYTTFRNISAEYRKGSLNTESYLAYVQQFGLSHLVCDLAQLLPDNQRKKELIEVYTLNLRSWGSDGNRETQNRGKEKNSTGTLADNIMNTVRELQVNYKPNHSQELVETLSKDGYRSSKGKSKLIDESEATSSSVMSNNEKVSLTSNDLDRTSGGDGLHAKQRRKAPKFLRTRLGEGFDKLSLGSNGVTSLGPGLGRSGSDSGSTMRGVWRNGSGQKLFSTGSSGR